MWDKNLNGAWERRDNFTELDTIIADLAKLKTYSKSLHSSGYMVTNTLADIYAELQFQHAFWVMTTTRVSTDALTIEDLVIPTGKLVNVLRHWSEERTLASTALRDALKNGLLKAANAALYKQAGAFDWFLNYTPNQDAYVGYENLLIDRQYTLDAWRKAFQNSDTELGFTVQHVFTSEKVTTKLLRNFHLVELASDVHLDVVSATGDPVEYPIVGFDETGAAEGYRVLLMGQHNPAQNGIYSYTGSVLVHEPLLETGKDAKFFSAYVKDGATRKGKEYFLARKENGTYPVQGEPLVFEPGTNYVLRNQITYRLQADHVFNDAKYFKQPVPRVDTSYADQQTVNGVTYFVEAAGKHLMRRNLLGDAVVSTALGEVNFLPRVALVGSTVIGVYADAQSQQFFAFTLNTVGAVTSSLPLQGKVLNFSATSGLSGPPLLTYVSAYAQQYHLYTGTNQLVYTSAVIITDAARFDTGTDVLYFVIENNDIVCLSGTRRNVVQQAVKPAALRVYAAAAEPGNVVLSWLDAGNPRRVSIPTAPLLGMFSWKKNEDYSFRSFSKTHIGDWEVINRQLFLKGVAVTNVADADLLRIPKVDDGTSRRYDGINDYSTLSASTVATIKDTPGFTVEFVMTPTTLKTNGVVFYFGEKSDTSTVETATGTFDFQASPKNYIAFYLADDTLYPYVQLCEAGKTFDVKSTQRLVAEQSVQVSFTWDYTPTKGTGRLYFDGELVGEASDTKNTGSAATVNLPLNVANIPFERCYLGKSESDKNPLFKGSLSEVRIWSRVFNLSQILARLHQGIDARDLLYKHLLGYWKLDDANSVHLDVVNPQKPGVFMGGLYQDANRARIAVVDQIQLATDYLYALDSTNSTIFRIDLATEQVDVHRATELTTNLKSLYLSGQTLYHLEGETIFTGDTVFHVNTQGSVSDFAVSQSGYTVLYTNKGGVYNRDNKLLFTDTVTTAFETLYVDSTTLYEKVYLKESGDTTHLLIGRGTAALEYITKYPFYKSETVTISTKKYAVDAAGVVTENGTVLDAGAAWWTPLAKRVFSLQARNQFLLVGIITHDDQVAVWQYDTMFYTGIALLQGTRSPNLFPCTSGVTDMCYYTNGLTEYLLLLDSDTRALVWYVLEKENKLAWKTLKWVYAWANDATGSYDATLTPQKLVVDGTKISLLSAKAQVLYLSTVTATTTAYQPWGDTLTYRYESYGILAGDAGLVFTDDSNWAVKKSPMLYKENFNAVESLVTPVTTTSGFQQPSWAGLSWLVGDKGRVFRSRDNAATWALLSSGVAHNLNAVSFYDERNGLVVGNHNTVLFTLSGGDTFLPVTLPASMGVLDWTSVHHYREDRALIAGSGGAVLHLSKKSESWVVDAHADERGTIGYLLASVYREQFTTDTYFRVIRHISQLGERSFLLSGDGDYLALLTLTFNAVDISYDFTFLKTGTAANWRQAVSYTDIVENKQKAFLLSDTQIYTIDLPAVLQTGAVNVNAVSTQLVYTHDTELMRIQLLDNYLLAVGRGASLFKKLLYEDNNGRFIAKPDSAAIKQDVSAFFKASLIYLDYSVARKVNLHKRDGSFEVPVGSFPKDKLNCFKFQEAEYVEFKDYGATNQQNNFLAYQDFFYLNRRGVAQGSTHGKMSPWRRYNKRLTATQTSTYHAIAVAQATPSATAAGANTFFVRNEALVGANLLGGVADEGAMTSRVYLRNPTLVAAENDVLKLTFLDPTRTKVARGDRLQLVIRHNSTLPLAYYYDSAVLDESDALAWKHFPMLDVVASGFTVAQLTTLLHGNALAHYQNLLRLRCTPIPTGFDVTVEVAVVKTEVLTTLRHLGTSSGVRVLVLDELFTTDMVLELNTCPLLLRNLNYFNGDLDHLQDVVEQHLLGQSYALRIDDPKAVIVTGKVNDQNLYYNLENELEVSSIGAVLHYPVTYQGGAAYAPSYSLLNILRPLSPVFTPTYAFALPSMAVKFSVATRTSAGLFQEFSVSANTIFAGQDVPGIAAFQEGHFVDLTRGAQTVKRLYLEKIEKLPYSRFPGKFRYKITTNLDVAGQLTDTSLNGTLRVRNTLAEISNDLEFTDNQMFPLPNTHEFNVSRLARSYFNQVKSGKAYATALLNDDNVRRTACGVVYIDETDEWNLNLINWREDINLSYKPVDLFEYGVDNTFKKSISLDLTNYEVRNNSLSLKNVELGRYNYTLIDGLRLKDLEARYHWILNADLRDATIGENAAGLVWYTGTWLSGSWEGGTWNNGTVYDIEWLGGDFYSRPITNEFNLLRIDTLTNDPLQSIWYNGTWKSGNFHNGTWYNGTFESGVHHAGTWLDGTFAGGFWKTGTFQGGAWRGGTWLSGTFNQDNTLSTWYDGTWLGGDFENGTWKNGTWDETDRVASRFGTKATYLKNAVWEYGLWKNGRFYSGSTTDALGVLTPSGSNDAAFWYNGTWNKGDFHGGTWRTGLWKNGIWHDGVLGSTLTVGQFNALSATAMRVTFATKHYYKELMGTANYLLIIGEPVYTKGAVSPRCKFLGYNMMPQKHVIKGIVDEYTVLIGSTPDFYDPAAVVNLSGQRLLDRCALGNCVDYTGIPVDELNQQALNPAAIDYKKPPNVVTHWVNGTWLAGIWQMGYFNNGTFKTGIWLNGVHEAGTFGV